jgi:hypothetical protein
MSDLNQIHTALDRLFNREGQRIVFWDDPDQDFVMIVPRMELQYTPRPGALALQGHPKINQDAS